MKHGNQTTVLSILFTALACIATSQASAAENDAVQVSNANIDLSRAIAVTEKKFRGKATRAEFDHEKGKPVFEVEVVSGHTVRDVLVDGDTGQIVKASLDRPDADNEQEDEGEHDR